MLAGSVTKAIPAAVASAGAGLFAIGELTGTNMNKRDFICGTSALLMPGLLTGDASAQANARAMIRLGRPDDPRPAASLADVAWLVGAWTGAMPEGPVESVFMSPRFGQMPVFVRATNKDGIIFYEIVTWVEMDGSLVLRLKHFTSVLTGWETQDGFIERPLLAIEPERLYFHQATYVRTGPDTYSVYFLNMRDGVEQDVLVIPFRRTA